MKKSVVFLFFFLSSEAFSYNRIWGLLKKSQSNRFQNYPAIIEALADEHLYYSSVPFIKEYLFKAPRISARLDEVIDFIATKVGIRQFELLPRRALKKATGPTFRYIRAKQLFRKRKYRKVVSILRGIRRKSHPVLPFSQHLMASSYALLGSYQWAQKSFQECFTSSEDALKRTFDRDRMRQLEINRDSCLLGRARVHFAQGKYQRASSIFSDLSKESPIWPDVLFEEAWTSFYKKHYNQTLGKLSTYNSPLLKFVFNPEVEELKAFSYLKMCLYSDAKKVVENFYANYEKDTKSLKRILSKGKKNFRFYYLLAKDRMEREVPSTRTLNLILGTIIRDPAFLEMHKSFQEARYEMGRIQEIRNKKLKRVLMNAMTSSIALQRDLMGDYVRSSLKGQYYQIKRILKSLSYIKLEVLSQKRERVFQKSSKRSRGDIRYLSRASDQYFWTFDEEFWIDELGDYVFSLKSECGA